ncbi:hypothetical protein LEP1GSC040_0858 [Leptospira santarosai str. 2000030832]|nr:hypothetical protein LEP1GSC040_0858 [Leptospira santarosai str. 2000030832]
MSSNHFKILLCYFTRHISFTKSGKPELSQERTIPEKRNLTYRQ